MDVLLGIAAVLLLAGTAAATVLVLPAMWQGFRSDYRRSPPGARRSGLVGGALAAVWIAVGAGLGIAEPWGPETVLYVILIGGGAILLATTAAVAFHVRREMRRARAGKRADPASRR